MSSNVKITDSFIGSFIQRQELSIRRADVTKEFILTLLREALDALEKLDAGEFIWNGKPVKLDLDRWSYAATTCCYVCVAGARYLNKHSALLSYKEMFMGVPPEERILDRLINSYFFRQGIGKELGIIFPRMADLRHDKGRTEYDLKEVKAWIISTLELNKN